MSEKKQCLALMLEVDPSVISAEGNKGIYFRFQDKVYLVASWSEVMREFKKIVIDEIWDIDYDLLRPYIDLPGHVDPDEFYESLKEIGADCQALVNPIILAFIKDLDSFVENLAEQSYDNNLGPFFAPFDYEQNYSETYNLFVYRCK